MKSESNTQSEESSTDCEEKFNEPNQTRKNKALVIEAFDTLFNKRDYAAAEKYWSPNYIQHSAHIDRVARDCSI